ncbi:hypothetical protein PBI_BUTTERS_7 [Mycobacterium phage Butters]|uniref:Uncharacterized protein n=3 Tax=Charlievirus TaxID=1623280 RepID=A0A2Z5HG06_9CAUD|nr:hypothetical protein K768_gp07 [Mycobacterium phage Butters]YP_010052010.1 hypothetical protein KD930_gp07 [Mycobacterium phage Kevin1]AXC38488.1 hypothetical protein SEA_RUBEELU_7 [Mycobacterium phage Rubeelu]WAW19093.1 hypothetical protein BIB10_7 [Mycobacterium phage BIB10]WAW19155.1 hypothetical protein BIB9_7 [Mycobacterium phage BIB9]WAW19217.1 hypothetical protein BIB8_7 [Mycobacterium phage BIB8]WAW19279.1 hypothetical protein BIB7_7 [Mycobacterium phage BIB7]WAW19341.1 hypothetic
MALIGFHTPDGEQLPPRTLEGGAVKLYNVVINGVETTLQLTDRDAAARGLLGAAAAPKAPAPATKAKTPANKAKTPANKANG